MSIHIGAMMPDRSLDDSLFIKAITKVATDLASLREHPVQRRQPILDIVFLLPSTVEKPGFEGLRLHSFDQAGQTLRIESAVPEKMLSSIHAERFILAIMLDAIDAAGEFFNEQQILFAAHEHLTLVELMTPSEQRTIH